MCGKPKIVNDFINEFDCDVNALINGDGALSTFVDVVLCFFATLGYNSFVMPPIISGLS